MPDNVAMHNAEAALCERVKELTCLYGIAQIASANHLALGDALQSIANLLPSAWQYPDIAHARITLDGRSYCTDGFRESGYRQTADIVIHGRLRGAVEVVYGEERPESGEGPFLREERNLIDAVARQLALLIERREAEEERLKLFDELRHADRLASLGLLAAGVAHELNEPLGNILGFAQLAKKCPALPDAARGDIEKIEAAALDAREVVKNLLAFARRMPPQQTRVDLNRVVQQGLTFFERRCALAGVELLCSLAPDLPNIAGDPAQLHHVLVNLVVNALQAMPAGGKLMVRTFVEDRGVSLCVEDTGVGMTDEVREKVFVPLFTTKDIGQGTGLGLPVVHGIVSAHGGSIHIESEVGRGTCVRVHFPVPARPSAEGNE